MHVGLAVAVAGPTLCRGHDGEDGPPRAPPASTTNRLVPGQVSRWNGFSAPAGTGRCLGGIAGSPPVRACTRIGVAAQGPRSRSLVVVFFWRLEVAGRPCPPKGRTGAWVSFPFLPATAPVVASAAIMQCGGNQSGADHSTHRTARPPTPAPRAFLWHAKSRTRDAQTQPRMSPARPAGRSAMCPVSAPPARHRLSHPSPAHSDVLQSRRPTYVLAYRHSVSTEPRSSVVLRFPSDRNASLLFFGQIFLSSSLVQLGGTYARSDFCSSPAGRRRRPRQ